jgi:hypothetical protein
MIRLDLKELLGFDYEFLNEEQTVAAIYTPFFYQDGDSVPVYVEESDGRFRFFDEGLALWHLISIGVPLDEPNQDKFVEDIARPLGVVLNEDGVLELFFEPVKARDAFTRFMSAMLSIVRWEYAYLTPVTDEKRSDFEVLTAGAPLNA